MNTKHNLNRQTPISAISIATLAVLAAVGTLNAQTIVAWDAKATDTTLTTSTASTIDANLSGPVNLILGPGFTQSAYGGTTFGGYATVNTSSGLASADSNGTYWQFTLTPNSGYQVEIDSLSIPTSYNGSYGLFTWQNGGNLSARACTINLARAFDSYGSSLGSASVVSLGADAGVWTLSLSTPLVISSAETFRIEFSEDFGWNTVGLQPDRSYWDPALLHNAAEINGAVTSVAVVPEPGSCALLLGGLGLLPLIRRRQV